MIPCAGEEKEGTTRWCVFFYSPCERRRNRPKKSSYKNWVFRANRAWPEKILCVFVTETQGNCSSLQKWHYSAPLSQPLNGAPDQHPLGVWGATVWQKHQALGLGCAEEVCRNREWCGHGLEGIEVGLFRRKILYSGGIPYLELPNV
jgi:hypothetical protein